MPVGNPVLPSGNSKSLSLSLLKLIPQFGQYICHHFSNCKRPLTTASNSVRVGERTQCKETAHLKNVGWALIRFSSSSPSSSSPSSLSCISSNIMRSGFSRGVADSGCPTCIIGGGVTPLGLEDAPLAPDPGVELSEGHLEEAEDDPRVEWVSLSLPIISLKNVLRKNKAS